MPYNLAEELVTYCLMMERKYFGPTTRSIKKMAFELAIENCLARSLSVRQGRAGWKWLRNFMCRHRRLRLRKPQITSAARVKGFTKINVANLSTYFSQCWVTSLPIAYLSMKTRVSLSFSIKYAKLPPLRESEGYLCLQQREVHSWQLLSAWMPPLRMFLLFWCFLGST